MNDEPKKPEEQQVPQHAPAQWEPRKSGEPGGLKHTLASGDESEYIADESQQATHLADDQQSLGSKLTGGGRDLGSEASEEVTRLCIGCGAVTTYIQGKCSKCGYKLGTESAPPPPAFGDVPAFPQAGTNPVMRNMLTGVIILVVIAVGVFVVMQFTGNDSGGVSDTSVTGADNAAGATATTSSAVTPGPFNPVTIDDDFHARLATALHQVNEAWTVAGTDCYIYRYGVFERLEGTQSQQITITGYIGGTAAQGLTPGGDEAFQESLAGYLDTFIMRGITVNVYLEFTNGEETPSLSDRYIKYGYYYALEHWDTLGAIVDALEGLKQANGQYPHALTESIVRPKIHTYGGLNFIAKGFGYLPLYKTGSDGYIIMGQGKGVASYYPEECAGYVLVMYLKTEKIGLDLFDPAGLNYYRENITPFPYEPKKKLTNMPLEPDDEPDGIACVIISGEIQDN